MEEATSLARTLKQSAVFPTIPNITSVWLLTETNKHFHIKKQNLTFKIISTNFNGTGPATVLHPH